MVGLRWLWPSAPELVLWHWTASASRLPRRARCPEWFQRDPDPVRRHTPTMSTGQPGTGRAVRSSRRVGSRHARKTAGRFRHELPMNQRSLGAGASRPTAGVVDGDSAQRHRSSVDGSTFHPLVGIGCHHGMREVGSVARAVVDATAIQPQPVGADPDAVGIRVIQLHSVMEGQC